ncbi:MAG: hypothetical protein Q8927_00170 [Bacteroidota bacterium]|nr:hypothetical protein [Bacteroidota bacterium]MDP4214580.1 hypothetical protein [Bacteroidota bacterium]MDP4247797.1 hypothetical protein [Bacteroidota bacterium]MDP4253854.1 hypothetical protein [Bacteroidota bacterium]MDP4257883.1 hypothetical protein [Bacteroidota bacterium]
MTSTSIANMEELKNAIRELEDQNYVNEQFMRRRVEHIVQNLKPLNIVKNLVHDVIKGSETRNNLLRMAAGLATSFVLKKFFRRRA